ncbi:MAG: HAD family phosphatase [Anaerolineaceae bacterium]|nr:HAD family phosphatase [Anaerolineaceae bacterium]
MDQEKTHISALFLDIGGVLLNNGWDRAVRSRAAADFHLDHDEMEERHHLTFDAYEEGKLRLDEYLERVVFYTARDFTVPEFKNYMFSKSRPFPETIDLVKRIKHLYRLKVAVVSNEGRELTVFRIQQFGLSEFVDFFISSCFVHFRKPDADIYSVALDVSQVHPEEVAYIEDREMFVEVANSLGIHGIHHTSVDATRKALASLGLVERDG